MKAADARGAQEFVETFRQVLSRRLAAVNLVLVDIGVKEHTGGIITPGVQQVAIVGWVHREITGQTATFTVRVGANFGDETDAADVEPMAEDITSKLIDEFYPVRGNS